MKRSLSRLVRSVFLPHKSKGVVAAPVDGQAVEPIVSTSVETVLRGAVNIDGLIASLQDGNADVARDAAIDLGRIGDLGAVQPLCDVLSNVNGYFHPAVRTAAASSLGQLKDASAVDALIFATGDSIVDVSEAAALALGRIADARAIEPLLNIVANYNGYFLTNVRRAAIQSLSGFHDARVKSVLLAVAINEQEDQSVREAAKAVGAAV